jgi:hypothetical protein
MQINKTTFNFILAMLLLVLIGGFVWHCHKDGIEIQFSSKPYQKQIYKKNYSLEYCQTKQQIENYKQVEVHRFFGLPIIAKTRQHIETCPY